MKTIGRLILSAIFLVLTGLLAAVAHSAPEQFFSFYPELSRKVLSAVSSVTAVVPFCVWEVLLLLAVLWLVYTLVNVFRRHGRGFFAWLSGIVLALSVFAFAFVGVWGLNHFGPTVAESLSLPVREYSAAELAEATRYYAAEASRLSSGVARDTNAVGQFSDFSTLSKKAGAGYETLAKKYALFTGSTDRVKKLATWKMFSHFGITGIFVCVTGEACVNPDTYAAWLPFTMCHEIAHRQTVAAEDGANFCAYLACMENPDAEFQYSGALAAYIYCSNALMKADRTTATEIWNSVDPGIRADAQAANAHYAQYEGKVQDAAQKVNDAYLKAFSEASGVQSYGEVADLLIAWYQQQTV